MSEYNCFASHFLVNIDKYENRKYLNDDRKFTRKGKISYRDTILYPLLQEGRTNSREANEYMRLITGDIFAMISQQAIGEKKGDLSIQNYMRTCIKTSLMIYMKNLKRISHIKTIYICM